jgi:hypothetical protein
MKVQWKPAGSIVCLMMLSVTVVVNAQSKSKCDTQAGKVGCLFPNLLAGETVQSTTHDPSFPNGDFEQNLSSVGTGIATQLSSVPVPATGHPLPGSLSTAIDATPPTLELNSTRRVRSVTREKLIIALALSVERHDVEICTHRASRGIL